jgi:hypothetical protein
MTESLSPIELKALAKRYPDLAFEDRLARGKPIADEYKFLRYQATRNVLAEVNSPAIAKVFDGYQGVNSCRQLVAHAETVGRLAEILAERSRAR